MVQFGPFSCGTQAGNDTAIKPMVIVHLHLMTMRKYGGDVLATRLERSRAGRGNAYRLQLCVNDTATLVHTGMSSQPQKANGVLPQPWLTPIGSPTAVGCLQ